MPEVHIAAETRDEFGKGAARRIRREGLVPAVLYGHGTETRHLNLPGHELMLALKTPNVLLYLDGLGNGSEIALPKAVQRDPVKGVIEHVDLILVRRGEKVTVDMQVRVTGEIAPDGMLEQQLVQIPVEAEATSIPQAIEVDVEGMEIGDAVHASDLTLPRGVSLQVDPETLVLHVVNQVIAVEPSRGRGRSGEAKCRSRWLRRPRRAKGSRPADPRTLDHRRPRQPRTGVRGQQAQRRPDGGRPARRAGRRSRVRFKAHRSGNDIADGSLAGVPVTVARPRSYMNLSGGPVAALAAFYKVPPGRLVVVHDELDIPFGSVRLKLGGGDNGHNGLRSITRALGTREYYRVRFGIGRPPGRMDPAAFVLRDFTAAERKDLPVPGRPRRRRRRDAGQQGPGRRAEPLPR